MSRIGKNPITVPQDIALEVNGAQVNVKGPKGELSVELPSPIKPVLLDGVLSFENSSSLKSAHSAWGLSRALVANMIVGVTAGFEKKLELIGVGYRVSQVGTDLSISVGYSNPVEFPAPEGITLSIEDNKNIVVSGIDKQLVGLVASKIRAIRPPEPYKGKGIKYIDEYVRRKAGKSGKV